MLAVILLGGQGTRLRALHPDVPKALAPVAGRPFLDWQYDWMKRGGVNAFHLAAGYKADRIEHWASSHPDTVVSKEPQPLGTGGALKFIERHVHGDPFIVVNGDSLSPALDFQQLVMTHKNRSNGGKSLTMAVTRIEQAGRYGTVEINGDGRITQFLEKADRANGWINAGVYVVSRAILREIPAGQNVSLEQDIFPALCRQERAFAYPVEPPMLDMGTPEGLRLMTAYLEKENL